MGVSQGISRAFYIEPHPIYFFDTALLSCTGWPQTWNPPASASRVLELNTILNTLKCTLIGSYDFYLSIWGDSMNKPPSLSSNCSKGPSEVGVTDPGTTAGSSMRFCRKGHPGALSWVLLGQQGQGKASEKKLFTSRLEGVGFPMWWKQKTPRQLSQQVALRRGGWVLTLSLGDTSEVRGEPAPWEAVAYNEEPRFQPQTRSFLGILGKVLVSVFSLFVFFFL